MEKRMRVSGAIGLLLGAGFMLAGETPAHAQAQARFDGSWNVLFVTESGSCDRAYRYPVAIENGALRYGGEAGFVGLNIAGQVDRRGTLKARVRRGGTQANASGRLQGRFGAGVWVAPTLGCSGRWRAERRVS